jgi:cold shock protein
VGEGVIKKLLDRGCGFISTAQGIDLFFHASSLQGVRFEELREGQRVSYTQGKVRRGPAQRDPFAENVKPV